MVGGERVLAGRYRLEEQIASGGMGTVYAAVDQTLHRRVAVKLLNEHLADDRSYGSAEGGRANSYGERFAREARASAALSHPNVAAVYDFGQDEGSPFIVMELVAGRDLARVLRDEGPLAPERARTIAAQLCDALAHAHAAGLIHRDVKAANVMVDDADRVKVTDFGIARAAGDSTLTATGSVLGSAHYISPEQASGEPVTPAADVYGAGIVLYEMLTNALPFTGDSPLAVALRHVSDAVPPPSRTRPGVPADLDRIVARATAKDPSARWRDAAAMAAALRGAAEATAPLGVGATQEIGPGGATAATTVWPIPGNRYDPRVLGARVLVAAGVLALGAAAVWVWILTRADEPRAETDVRDGGRRAAVATQSPEAASQEYELESFVGFPYKEAEKALEARGLVVTPEEVPSDRPKDEVLGSDPPPGTAMSPGEPVTLIVSAGEPDEEPQDEDEDEGPGNSEDAPGHDKDKEKDGD